MIAKEKGNAEKVVINQESLIEKTAIVFMHKEDREDERKKRMGVKVGFTL